MDAKLLIVAVVQFSLVVTVFGFGLKATLDDALYLFRRPGLLARSVVAMFLFAPVLAIVLARALEFRSGIEIALVSLALSPLPPMMPKKLDGSDGQTMLAVSLMATLTALSVVLIPVSAGVLSLYLARPLAAPASVASIIVLFALAPLAAGMAVDAWLPKFADRIERSVALIGEILLPLAVLGLVTACLPAMWAIVGNGTIAAIVAYVVGALAVGHWLGGPDPDDRVALALSSACRHPGIAAAIGLLYFRDADFGATILHYLLISAVVGALYVAWQRWRQLGSSLENWK